VTPATPPDTTRRDERLIGSALVVAFLSGVAFAVVFALRWNTQVGGVLIAVALASFGTALVWWGHRLLAEPPATDDRHPLSSEPEDIAAFEAAFDSEGLLERRSALRRLLMLAAGGLAAAAIFPIRSLGPRPRARAVWRDGVGLVDSDGHAIRADDVPTNSLVTAFPADDPANADGAMVLIRVRSELLRPEAGREGWSPDGLLAYSKVCTHAGCPVGLYQSQSHTLLCPCHQSVFDVLHAARPTSGPAAAPLPQLPLRISDDGTVVAAGGPSGAIGPAGWSTR
jgi:ubiquinol-cytochrome c reductase iron-sulfur subunit